MYHNNCVTSNRQSYDRESAVSAFDSGVAALNSINGSNSIMRNITMSDVSVLTPRCVCSERVDNKRIACDAGVGPLALPLVTSGTAATSVDDLILGGALVTKARSTPGSSSAAGYSASIRTEMSTSSA